MPSMPRIPLLIACLFAGCTQAIELRTIEQFSAAMHQADLKTAKEASSERFEERALRLTESLDDFKILNLPKGETTVAKIEEISEDEKHVQVEVGANKYKLLYKLTRKPGGSNKDWVVDDIWMRQKRKGITAKKSVTEQMDLLLSVREVLQSWQHGKRAEILQVSTPEMRELLAQLPEESVEQLAQKIIGKRAIERKHQPEAHLDRDVAVVNLQRSTGRMIMSFKLMDGEWKLDDLAVESRGDHDHIPSLRKTVTVMIAGLTFLNAYSNNQKKLLEKVSVKELYENSLKPALLTDLPLPSATLAMQEMQVKTFPQYAEILIAQPQQILTMTLTRGDNQEEDIDAQVEYLVEDVTIHELATKQQKRLSSYFTAHAVMQLFHESLSNGDTKLLQQLCTPDFNEKVWKRATLDNLRGLPLGQLTRSMPKVLETRFQGPLTEIDAQFGKMNMVYQLRTWNGRVLVDDLIIPHVDFPSSLKAMLDVTIPTREFLTAFVGMDLNGVRMSSALDFNRVIWSQTTKVPSLGANPNALLSSQIHSVKIIGEEAVVELGTPQRGARIMLKKEREQFLVDDILLIAGIEPSQRAELKRTLKDRIVLGNGAVMNGTSSTDITAAMQNVQRNSQPNQGATLPPVSPNGIQTGMQGRMQAEISRPAQTQQQPGIPMENEELLKRFAQANQQAYQQQPARTPRADLSQPNSLNQSGINSGQQLDALPPLGSTEAGFPNAATGRTSGTSFGTNAPPIDNNRPSANAMPAQGRESHATHKFSHTDLGTLARGNARPSGMPHQPGTKKSYRPETSPFEAMVADDASPYAGDVTVIRPKRNSPETTTEPELPTLDELPPLNMPLR